MSRALSLVALLALSWPCLAADQWLVVTAPAHRQALEPLSQHRKAQGFDVTVLQTTDVLTANELVKGDAAKLRDKVCQLCRDYRGMSYVLLVGAVDPAGLDDPTATVMPALKGTAGRMKGQPSDHGYGSPDDDFIPTVAVGRFPARCAAETREMVRKTLAFERDTKPGAWKRQVTILAGAPEFNPFVDKLVERVALSRLEKLAPCWRGRAIFHNAQSRFTLPDDEIHDRALKYVQQGQALTLYLGHSNAHGFYAGRSKYLDRDDWSNLSIARGAGVFATFGCLGCQLSGQDGEGYGVVAIRNPGGPVAVLGSHGVCFAAMVHLAADALFEHFLAGPPPERLGPVWLQVRRAIGKGPLSPITFKLLDAVDGDPSIPQATQRREHLEMFMLLGDPALLLPGVPEDVELAVNGSAKPGADLRITGRLPKRLQSAQIIVTLERLPGSEPSDLLPLPAENDPARARVMRDNHARANQFALIVEDAIVRDGHFELRLRCPDALPWPRLLLRCSAANATEEGMGCLLVPVEP